MKKHFPYILCVLAACGVASVSGAGELVREFSGTGGATTAEFEVQAPWILDWRVNSEFQKSMAIEIHLVDGLTGLHEGLLVQTKRAGNGVKLFGEGGRYRFRISASFARWNLKVEELTREEAELYKAAR